MGGGFLFFQSVAYIFRLWVIDLPCDEIDIVKNIKVRKFLNVIFVI